MHAAGTAPAASCRCGKPHADPFAPHRLLSFCRWPRPRSSPARSPPSPTSCSDCMPRATNNVTGRMLFVANGSCLTGRLSCSCLLALTQAEERVHQRANVRTSFPLLPLIHPSRLAVLLQDLLSSLRAELVSIGAVDAAAIDAKLATDCAPLIQQRHAAATSLIERVCVLHVSAAASLAQPSVLRCCRPSKR